MCFRFGSCSISRAYRPAPRGVARRGSTRNPAGSAIAIGEESIRRLEQPPQRSCEVIGPLEHRVVPAPKQRDKDKEHKKRTKHNKTDTNTTDTTDRAHRDVNGTRGDTRVGVV